MVGKEDLLTPVRFSEQLAQGIPNAELAILEQGGHAFVVESADTVAKIMLDFLRGIDNASYNPHRNNYCPVA